MQLEITSLRSRKQTYIIDSVKKCVLWNARFVEFWYLEGAGLQSLLSGLLADTHDNLSFR